MLRGFFLQARSWQRGRSISDSRYPQTGLRSSNSGDDRRGRTSLYRQFERVWRSIERREHTPGARDAALDGIEHLPPIIAAGADLIGDEQHCSGSYEQSEPHARSPVFALPPFSTRLTLSRVGQAGRRRAVGIRLSPKNLNYIG